MIRKPYKKRIKEIHSAMSDLTVQLVDCYDNVLILVDTNGNITTFETDLKPMDV